MVQCCNWPQQCSPLSTVFDLVKQVKIQIQKVQIQIQLQIQTGEDTNTKIQIQLQIQTGEDTNTKNTNTNR